MTEIMKRNKVLLALIADLRDQLTVQRPEITDLKSMITSEGYQEWIDAKLGQDLFISDPERADRIAEGAEAGTMGSTNWEVIHDHMEYLNNLSVFYPDESEDMEIVDFDITEATYKAIENELVEIEQYHKDVGTLEMEVGL